jgi:hypothetical protein
MRLEPEPLVRCACNDCQSGWMARLESEVRPILAPMLHGAQTRLMPTEQGTLAAWAVRVAAVQRCIGDDLQEPMLPDHYTPLRETLEPPLDTYVFVGRYEGPRRRVHWTETIRLSDAGRKLPARANGYYATLTIGQVIFQVFGSSVAGAEMDGVPDRLLQIWKPVDAIAWPPESAVSEPDLEGLARASIAPIAVGQYRRFPAAPLEPGSPAAQFWRMTT